MFRIDRSRVQVTDIKEPDISEPESPEITTPAELPDITDCDALPETELEQHLKPDIEPEPEPEPLIDYVGLALKQAAEIIEEAHRDADALRLRAEEHLRQAEADSENILTEAKKLGYELGYNEGRADGENELAVQALAAQDAFSRTLNELERGRQEMLNELEGDIIGLCFSIVRKIASIDRNDGGELFFGVIQKALSQLDLSGNLTLRLSQEDCERFFPGGEASFDLGDVKITIPASANPQLEPGDVIIESEGELLVAGVETQLRKIELSFNQMIGNKFER